MPGNGGQPIAAIYVVEALDSTHAEDMAGSLHPYGPLFRWDGFCKSPPEALHDFLTAAYMRVCGRPNALLAGTKAEVKLVDFDGLCRRG